MAIFTYNLIEQKAGTTTWHSSDLYCTSSRYLRLRYSLPEDISTLLTETIAEIKFEFKAYGRTGADEGYNISFYYPNSETEIAPNTITTKATKISNTLYFEQFAGNGSNYAVTKTLSFTNGTDFENLKTMFIGGYTPRLFLISDEGYGFWISESLITITTTSTLIESITLSPSSLTLTEGETATINATVSPDNATNKKLSWSSNKTSVATVDSNGKVTAVSAGSAIITCAAKDGSGISTNCNVTIQSQINDALQSATIKQYPTELYVEETYQLELILNPTNASIKAIEWTSSDKSIATISNTGLVTALYNLNLKSKKELTFTCLITDIYDNSIEVSCSFYIVQKYVTVISLNPEAIEITVGEEITISASIFPISAINKTITWFYNNAVLEKISEDSSTITLRGIKAGESSIICSANDQNGLISAEGSISVVEINIPVTNIELEPTEVTLGLGQSQTFSISIFPENATNKDIEWRSPNTDFYDYISLLNNTITVIKADENIDRTFILYVYSKSDSNISKSCIITVSRIKTYNAYIFIEGEYRPAKAYIYNGGWQECSSVYIYNDGWKQTTTI